MEKDLSKKTILVLVVLTLVISIFSLFTVVSTMNSNSNHNYVPTSVSTTSANGEVNLGLKEVIEPDSDSGKVVLNIINEV